MGKLEIDCKGGEELANKTYVQSNQLAGPFVVEGLVSETEYECRARMVHTEGGKDDLGPWTKETRVKTLKEDKIVGMATGDNNEEASDSLKKEEVDNVDNGIKKAETTSVAPTAIGIGCVVVIVALAVAVAWRTMAGKKVAPNPLLQDPNDLDGNLSEVLVSSEEEVNIVDEREPSSWSETIKDASDPIKDQHGSIVGALELSAPHLDAREA